MIGIVFKEWSKLVIYTENILFFIQAWGHMFFVFVEAMLLIALIKQVIISQRRNINVAEAQEEVERDIQDIILYLRRRSRESSKHDMMRNKGLALQKHGRELQQRIYHLRLTMDANI